MKCPKCGYLGFEDMERCRNCGYDFSLTEGGAALPELNLRRDTRKLSPLDDLTLVDAAMQPAPSGEDLDGAGAFRPTPPRPPRSSTELPLFRSEPIDDEPLIRRASPPRAPLAVRRATPEVPRVRSAVRAQSLDFALDLDDPLTEAEAGVFSPAERATAEEWPAPRPERAEPAAVSQRLVAVLIDLAILAVIDIAVLYFTMKICGVTLDELNLIPKVPLLAFLLFQNGGYLAAFTAGGQTLGKMATGIRVVATESAGTLDLNRAITRTIVWLLLAVPAGLGFLTCTQPRSPGAARSTRRHARRPRHHLTSPVNRVALTISTSLGIGYVPFAPGTFGSAAGLLVWALLPASPVVHGLVIVLLFVVGSWSGGIAERHFQRTDPGQVVIDEVLGMLITLFLIPVGWPGAIVGFLLFRAADIIKPFPANRLERLSGGTGVMADDAMAAVYANLALRATLWVLARAAG